MGTHEHQATMQNKKTKRGLNGRAAGRAEAARTTGDVPYALGDLGPEPDAVAPALYTGRPAVTASSPSAGTVRVVVVQNTADGAAYSGYNVYADDTKISGADPTANDFGENEDFADVDPGTYDITVRVTDEDGTEFAVSDADEVVVA